MFENKKVVIFDLDGTLAESKQELDPEMSELINRLLKKKIVAVISGGAFHQFKKQFLSNLSHDPDVLDDLHLFPTSGTAYYHYQNGSWIEVYSKDLTKADKKEIIDSLKQVERAVGIKDHETYGEKIEDRQTQITYSGLGQDAPLELKEDWDPHQEKRSDMVRLLNTLLPEFETRIGGSTSIDITHKGIDKAYGINKIQEVLKIPIEDMMFVGDALFPGGNDYPATKTGIDCVKVDLIEDTKKLIKRIIEEGNE